MTKVRFGRVVHLVREKADPATPFRIGLEAIESGTGRLVSEPVTDYAGPGTEFKNGDLLFGKLRPYLSKAWLADRDGAAVGDFHVYRPTDRVSARYLRWVLLARNFLDPVVSSVFGAKMPRADWGFIRNVEIHVPPMDEQQVIADYLDRESGRIDTLIEEQLRLIEILRERRGAVLAEAFSPGSTTETTKVGRLLSVRPSYGVLVPRYTDDDEGVPLVRVGDLLNLTPERPLVSISIEQSDEYSRTKITGGEVLLGVVGKMGQAVVAPQWLAGANVARAVAVLRCKDPSVAPLLCSWLGSDHFLRQAEIATSGDSIQPTLGMKDLAGFDINLPSYAFAADVSSRLARMDMLIAETERFIELARERRGALVTAAVTGQIDAREMA